MNVRPQKRKYQPKQTEYKISQSSSIVFKNFLPFLWKSLKGGHPNETQSPKKIDEENNPAAQVGDTVSVKAKVIAKLDVETVFSYKLNKALNKSDTMIVDSTNAMCVTLWGQAIEKVEHDQSYRFTDLHYNFTPI